ncbi:MAG: hypothetical protein JSR36_10365 [Proteobacteria bacterium]|nr:hypothetical protein [Pseudomonadota bacterium]
MSSIHRSGLVPIAMAVAGFTFGLAYFALLRRTALTLALPSGSRYAALALTLGRIATAIVFFLLAARIDVLALFAALAGFLMARTVSVHAGHRGA